MELRIPKKYIAFILIYFVTILSLLLDQVEGVPFTSILRKIKYGYIILMACYWIVNIFNHGRRKFSCGVSAVFFVLLLIHTILFGFVFTNAIVADYISEHAIQMLIFISYAWVTFYYIKVNHCLELYLLISYIACVLTLVIAFLLHYGEGLNFIWGIYNAFTDGYGRYRATYGFVHGGYLSYHCFVTLAISLILFKKIGSIEGALNRRRLKILLFCSDFFVFILLCMASMRGGILATAFMFLFLYLFNYLKNHKFKFNFRKLLFFIFVVALLILVLIWTGAWDYIWEKSNRSLNISVNLPVFQALGNFWTGMGWVENSVFQAANNAFGMATSSLDMYYVYIFFTTGTVGSIIIGSIVMGILIFLFKNINKQYVMSVFAIYLAMLFFAFWECNLFNYRFQPGIILTILLFYMCDKVNPLKNNKE